MKAFLAFDIDGTIYDPSPILVPAFREGILAYSRENGRDLSVPSHEKTVEVLGIPIDEIFSRLFPELDVAERKELEAYCTDRFVKMIGDKKGNIYSGADITVRQLFDEGHTLLVASNGSKEYVEAILATYSLLDYFSKPRFYTGEGIPDKTTIVASYLKEYGKDTLVIMIGDRFTDREAAEKNGIPFIACIFGHDSGDELAGCEYMARSFREIPPLIKKIEDSWGERRGI